MGRPEGVRIVRPDGTEVPCELEHKGYNTEENMDEWVIATDVEFRPGLDQLRVDTFPARTALGFKVRPRAGR